MQGSRNLAVNLHRLIAAKFLDSLIYRIPTSALPHHMPVGIDFGVKKVYKSPKSIHRADAKGLTSSSKLSVSCVLTLQTLPLITFTPLHSVGGLIPGSWVYTWN